MNPQELEVLHLITKLRTQMMDSLSDADLAFTLPHNPPLGELCREMGDVERAYIDSFKTLKQVWNVRNTEPGLVGSVERLKAWYRALDSELDVVLAAIPDGDFQTKMIDRSEGFSLPIETQVHVYCEAILIFCGRWDVYLRALDKPLTQQWRDMIG